MLEQSLDQILELIRNAYSVLDQFSITGLIVVSVAFTLAFLFAIREAASWFLKIDDVKSDVRKLSDVILHLEGEVRALQGLISQAKNQAAASATSAPTTSAKSAPEPRSLFPITH
jgi:outer membrane murein-binding lipoprotein Lpp